MLTGCDFEIAFGFTIINIIANITFKVITRLERSILLILSLKVDSVKSSFFD